MNKIVECIPNFCVGQDQETIERIADSIRRVDGIILKCVDTGFYANRSVFTFLGPIEAILEAAEASIDIAVKHIDMRLHHGEHPRFGAVDVFPFVALDGISSSELNQYVNKLATKLAAKHEIPTYLYEQSATRPQMTSLADIRRGEYEGLETKMNQKEWTPDFYPYFNPRTGGMVMGVRSILVAFNVNLDTKDVIIARKIAADLRESGRKVKRGQEYINIPGRCAGVRAIGWYIRDFDKVQVSMNIIDYHKTSVHEAFETCNELANKYGVYVTGSELIGCIPKKCLIAAGKFYAQSDDITNMKAIQIAVDHLHLNEVKPFDLDKNLIDY